MSELAPVSADAVAGSVAPGELQPGDAELVLAVLESRTYAEAGERCGVSERTVQRRMAEPYFRAAVTSLAYQRLEATVWRLLVDAPEAAEMLRALRGEAAADAGAAVRLKAAQATLELTHKLASALAAKQSLETGLVDVEMTLQDVTERLRRAGL